MATVNNIVATADLNCQLDLDQIEDKIPMAHYDPPEKSTFSVESPLTISTMGCSSSPVTLPGTKLDRTKSAAAVCMDCGGKCDRVRGAMALRYRPPCASRQGFVDPTHRCPRCGYVCFNYPSKTTDDNKSTTGEDVCGPYSTFRNADPLQPKKPSMANYNVRLASFTAWPKIRFQREQDMAAAGFIFLGPNDRVECFSCGQVVEAWHPDDDVWEEHARIAPYCQFVLQTKGDQFIDIVLEKFKKRVLFYY
ncbi:E3 ubiquitin-protein ligase XIAP-like [Paramacrobiotus metropolitanus]|uniref:E3 ubiquitin-protein ligase XIAP-like n=1 Tax=Paramacrobiotus metropolitanus TaxID=2943436 RepID=UPI00244588DD|nr:E3 ubiquitin-protein ligase XIAP-like [Paramacrobiotus metropolitanus]